MQDITALLKDSYMYHLEKDIINFLVLCPYLYKLNEHSALVTNY